MSTPTMSNGALQHLAAWLPTDLNSEQMDQVLKAAAHAYQVAFQEGRVYQTEQVRVRMMTTKQEQP